MKGMEVGYSRATMEGRNTLRMLQKYNKTISTINVDCIDITFSRYITTKQNQRVSDE